MKKIRIYGLFTWIVTAIGSGLVFFINSSNRKVLDISLGFTGGVMIAASFWSLLAPSIEYAEMQNELGLSEMPSWLAPTIGFFLGALFLFGLDKIIPHLHLFEKKSNAEGVNTKVAWIKADHEDKIAYLKAEPNSHPALFPAWLEGNKELVRKKLEKN